MIFFRMISSILLTLILVTSCRDNIISEAGFKNNFNLSWTNEFAYSSSYSLKIEFEYLPNDIFSPVNQSINRNEAYWYQTINASSLILQNIRLSAAIKLENVGGEGVSFEILAYNSNNEIVSSISSIRWMKILGTKNWKRYNLDLSGVPRSTQTIVVKLKISKPTTKGAVYFDDVMLSANQVDNYLINSDLETGHVEPDSWFGQVIE